MIISESQDGVFSFWLDYAFNYSALPNAYCNGCNRPLDRSYVFIIRMLILDEDFKLLCCYCYKRKKRNSP